MADRATARAHLVMVVSKIVEALKTYDELYSRLWAGVQRLWNGGKDANFLATFARSIDRQLTDAWNSGADEMGVAPEDMSEDDMAILTGIIDNENTFIQGLADDIQSDNAGGMSDADFQSQYSSRVEMWANRWSETYNTAKIRFGGKQRLQFTLGATEKHCHTGDVPGKVGCADLDGIVLFADEWSQTGIVPNVADSPVLACGGWRCKCQLQPTDSRRTRGGLTRVLEMLTGANL